MIINAYVDEVLMKIMKKLGLEIPEYDTTTDPTKIENVNDKKRLLEWTIRKSYIEDAQSLYDIYCRKKRRRTIKKDKKEVNTKIETIVIEDLDDD